MCGIVTVLHPSKNIDNTLLIEQYVKQRNRGTKGYGYTYLTPKGYLRTMKFEDEAMCFYHLGRVKSKLIMFHHRFPTSTSNVSFQNHPIAIKTEKGYYSMVHNGVISNARMIKATHHEGLDYSTAGKNDFNDSETLAHEVVRFYEEGKKIRAEGTIAVVLLVADRKRRFKELRYGRNYGNPLYHCVLDDETHIISSENDELKLTEQVDAHELFGLQWTKKGKLEWTEQRSCSFPSYISTVNRVSRWKGGSRTPYSQTNAGFTKDSVYSDTKKLADGSFIVRNKSKEQPKKEVKKLNKHEEYVATMEMAELYAKDLAGFDPSVKSAREIQETLKTIDDLLKDCAGVHQTRRIQRARHDLLAHRGRILPVKETLLHSLFKKPSVASGETNSKDEGSIMSESLDEYLDKMDEQEILTAWERD